MISYRSLLLSTIVLNDTLLEIGQKWVGGKGSPPVAGFTFLWPDNFVAYFQKFIKILGKDGTHKIR